MPLVLCLQVFTYFFFVLSGHHHDREANKIRLGGFFLFSMPFSFLAEVSLMMHLFYRSSLWSSSSSFSFVLIFYFQSTKSVRLNIFFQSNQFFVFVKNIIEQNCNDNFFPGLLYKHLIFSKYKQKQKHMFTYLTNNIEN